MKLQQRHKPAFKGSLFSSVIYRSQLLRQGQRSKQESIPSRSIKSLRKENKDVVPRAEPFEFTLIGKSLQTTAKKCVEEDPIGKSSSTLFSLKKKGKFSSWDPRVQYIKIISLNPDLLDYSSFPIILGHGTYSHVYKGRFFSEDVAVKQFNKSSDPLINRRHFLHEGLITLQLRHPNIIQLLGVIYGEEESLFALVYEYMNLGSLEKYILDERQPLPLNFTRIITSEVGQALLYLHDRKIAHLDVKSSNVLLSDSSGRIVAKLADLGFAQKLLPESQSMISNIRGTPSWMAPEILVQRKRRFMHPSADIFSFGILLWQLFERREPYKDLTIQEVYELKAKNHHLPTSSRTPELIVGVLKLCWTQNPYSRPSIDQILQMLAKQATTS